MDDWSITFVDTGANSLIGDRLRRVRRFVEDAETFLSNYADSLTDCPINDIVDHHRDTGATATIMAARPPDRSMSSRSTPPGTRRAVGR